jgi:hypothetical protein
LEKPTVTSKIAKNNLLQTPIDEIDAAVRILNPIFTAVNSEGSEAENLQKVLSITENLNGSSRYVYHFCESYHSEAHDGRGFRSP